MKSKIIFLLFILLSGCNDEKHESSSLVNIKWTLLAIQNTSTKVITNYPENLSKESIIFDYSSKTIGINGVCNGCSGNYSLNSDNICVDITGCTKIYCDGVNWEEILTGNLDSTYAYQTDSDHLTMYSNGRYNLIFSSY